MQAHARPIPRLAVAPGAQHREEAAEHGQHPRRPAGANNGRDLVSQSGPIELPLVALIGGTRHGGGLDDGDAVL